MPSVFLLPANPGFSHAFQRVYTLTVSTCLMNCLHPVCKEIELSTTHILYNYFTSGLHVLHKSFTTFFFFCFFFLHILYTVWVFGKIPALCLSMLFAEYPNCFPPTHMIYMEFTPCSACALQWVLHMLYNEFALCRHALYTAFTSALHKDMPCLHIVYTWFATIFKDPLFTWALQVYMVFAHSTPFQSVLCR